VDLTNLRRKAEEAARTVLKQYWASGALPVDPVVIARSMGVEVFSAQLGNDVIGLILINGQTAQIYVDEDQPSIRYRYTTTHQLGHYIRHRGSPSQVGFVDRRSGQDETDPEELFANYFAAALLMPEDLLDPEALGGLSDFAIAAMFGVPLDALRFRRPLAA